MHFKGKRHCEQQTNGRRDGEKRPQKRLEGDEINKKGCLKLYPLSLSQLEYLEAKLGEFLAIEQLQKQNRQGVPFAFKFHAKAIAECRRGGTNDLISEGARKVVTAKGLKVIRKARLRMAVPADAVCEGACRRFARTRSAIPSSFNGAHPLVTVDLETDRSSISSAVHSSKTIFQEEKHKMLVPYFW
ncbi:Protein of unknown function [Gryllus bimaculatus]|nr:Protein of unknown function [Gryllus bimaculatus]